MKSFKIIKQMQAGFTLIELMVVVAIIGILASAAIPAYSDYAVKAKIANALTSVEVLKLAVAECAQGAGGVLTGCSTTTGAVATNIPAFTVTKEVQSASVADGAVTFTFATGVGTGVDNGTVTLTPTTGSTAMIWTVGTTVTNVAAQMALKKNN